MASFFTQEGLEQRLAVLSYAGGANRATNDDIRDSAQAIADNLRTSGLRDALGAQAFASIARQLQNKETNTAAATQLFRVIGNACIDHDVNRKHCLQQNICRPLLMRMEQLTEPEYLREEDLLCLKAAMGALLNLTMENLPAQRFVIQTAAIPLLLSIINPFPPQGRPLYLLSHWEEDIWTKTTKIELASTTQLWALRILEEIVSNKSRLDDVFPQDLDFRPIASMLRVPEAERTTHKSDFDVSDTDCSMMLICAEILESLTLDLAPVRKKLGRSDQLLQRLFDFVEFAQVPQIWPEENDEEGSMMRKTWGNIKAAVSRSIIACASEDEVMDLIMGDESKSWVINRLREYLTQEARGDLVITASIMLANLGRKDAHCVTLVQIHQLVPPLVSILRKQSAIEAPTTGATKVSGEKYQILHGVVSLLKHLAIPPSNKPTIGQAGVIEPTTSLLQDSYDMAQPVQVAAIGLLKHLTLSNLPNCLAFLNIPDGLPRLLGIISRSDEVRLKSEGSRILVNLIHTLWSQSASEAEKQKLSQNSEVYAALSEMIRSSAKYPILVNQGVTALALLATSGAEAAEYTASRLLHKSEPLAKPDGEESKEQEDDATPVAKADGDSTPPSKKSPDSASLQLVDTLRKVDTPNEMTLNIIQLLQILLATLPSESTSRQELQVTFRQPIAELIGRTDGPLSERAKQVQERL